MRYTIRHYPTHMIDVIHLSDGTRVVIRPVLPQDAALTQAMVGGLSDASRYLRFLAPVRQLPAAWLERFTQVDYRQQMALIAETVVDGEIAIIAEARYVSTEDAGQAEGMPELALLVADAWQRRGLGQRMLTALIGHARRLSLAALKAEVLSTNNAMLKVLRRAGFNLQTHPEDRRLVLATISLQSSSVESIVREDHPSTLLA
jgi:acetyltransferase